MFSQELGRIFKGGFEGLERKVDGVSDQVARVSQVRAKYTSFRDLVADFLHVSATEYDLRY
jgi:hypothetical protein